MAVQELNMAVQELNMARWSSIWPDGGYYADGVGP